MSSQNKEIAPGITTPETQRIGPELPEIYPRILQYEEAQDYYIRLKALGMVPDYPIPGLELRYIGPIEVSKRLALELVDAADGMWRDISSLIEKSEGITEWQKAHPACFSGEPLNNAQINEQLAKLISEGWTPPLVYDVIITNDGPRVVEVQTCIAYGPWESIVSEARGDKERDQSCLFNGDPAKLVSSLKKLSGTEDITVVDMYPRDGVTSADKIAMAQVLGNEGSQPISPLEIRRDTNGYYYFHPKTGALTRIRHVLCRMLQPDLDALNRAIEQLSSAERIAQKDIVTAFLNDPSINWVWHPGWTTLICKDALPWLSRTESQASYKEHLVASYGPGEECSKSGRYICKPIAGSGGGGQKNIDITNTPYTIPQGHILQEYIQAATVKVPVPVEIVKEGYMPGMVELRVMPPMHRTGQPGSTYLYARLVPRYGIDPGGNLYTPQTNTGPATIALASLAGTQGVLPDGFNDRRLDVAVISRELFRCLPFGQGPAVVA